MSATTETAMYSYVNMVLLSILAGGFTVMCTLLAWWASDVNKKLQTLANFHATQSAEVMRMTSWTISHDKSDDERQEENNKKLDRNHSATHDLRTQLSDFAMRIGSQISASKRLPQDR